MELREVVDLVSPKTATLYAVVRERAARNPEAVALGAPGRRPLTYGRLLEQMGSVVAGLRARGVGAGAPVALVVPGGPELASAIVAVACGAGVSPLSVRHRVAEYERIFSALEPSALVVWRGAGESAREAAARRGVPVLEIGAEPGWDAGAFGFTGQEPVEEAAEADFHGGEDVAVLLTTSGTTSRPKVVPLRHRNVNAAARNTARALGLGPEDRCLNLMPLHHSHGLIAGVWASLLSGGAVYCPPAFDAAAFVGWLKELEPTWYTAVPTMHQAVLEASVGRESELAGHRMRFVRSASAYLPPAVLRGLESLFGVPVTESYGLTEAPQLTNTPLERELRRPGSLGVADTTAVAIMDEAGRLLGPTETGEIVARGPGVMAGYLNDAAGSKAAFRDGWLRTGDLGYLDREGHLYLTGRIKEIINRGGEKIAPQEIEAVLLEHPAVSQALAFGMAHASLDEDVGAAVVLRGGEAVTGEELRTYALSQLSEHRAPRRVFVVGELPKSATGKLLRREAAAAVAELVDRPAYEAPRTVVEAALVGIWEEVLDRSPIGIRDDFFELGGQSLLATRVASLVRQRLERELELRAFFEAPTVAELAEVVTGVESAAAVSIERAPREAEALPLSFAQQRLWLLDRLEPGSVAYSMPEALRLRGALDVGALVRALEEIVRRHASLRTTFGQDAAGEPYQRVAPFEGLGLEVEPLAGTEPAAAEARARALAAEEAARPFDLSAGPLFRVRLLRLEARDHVLLWNMHHVISDGWSKGLLRRELSALYGAFRAGGASPLPELEFQYGDYAYWQRRHVAGELLDRQLAYWKERLAGAPELLELPADRPRPAVISERGGAVSFELDGEVAKGLLRLARRERVTPYQVLLAAFQVLLGRHAGQDDVVLGTPVAGRTRAELEPLIGFFVNTLVVRTRLRRGERFRELLGRVREQTLETHRNQDVPFDRLVEAVRPKRSRSYSPIFQAMFIVQNIGEEALALPGLEVAPLARRDPAARFDLTLSLAERAGRMDGTLLYRTDLFDASTIQRMADSYATLVGAIAADPDEAVDRLPLLTGRERDRQLVSWQAPALPVSNRCVHHLFEDRVAAAPDAPAVTDGDRTLRYAELNAAANRLAHRLRSHGVGPDTVVGLQAGRGVDAIVAMLGILKAGGAFLPLDPRTPWERARGMLADAAAAVLVRDQDPAAPPAELDVPVVALGPATAAGGPAENPDVAMSPENLAYVIYTSGSTGRPKGVAVEHAQVVNYAEGIRTTLGLTTGASFATVSTLAADLGNTSIFSALLGGGCLHVMPADRLLSGEAFAEYMERNAVDGLKITPSHLAALQEIDDPARLLPRRWLILGGEASSLRWIDALLATRPACAIYNHYGPTETTVGVLTYRVGSDRPETVSSTLALGRPLPNTRIYVVDNAFQPVPVGVAGELLIGGDAVARGYLDRPELTAERFLPDPFAPGRVYRTGDRVRYLADGNLEFLGRLDDQVKVRGYRVEPGEVEVVLAGHEGVRAGAVLAVGDSPADRRLVAYYVGDVAGDVLREHVQARVPDYMVPSAFVRLARMPLTANGKVDRAALPAAPELARTRDFSAPRTQLEWRLAAIWQELLGMHRIGIDDDFFELGGTSLLGVRLFTRIRRELAPDSRAHDDEAPGGLGTIQPSILWEAPTIRRLAGRLTKRVAVDPLHRPLIEVQRGRRQPPFVMLAGDWFGMGVYLRELARRTDSDLQVYALMPHDITAEGSPGTVEAMAELHVHTLRERQPTGPYYLGGYSAAGLVAMEMARMLRASGQEVKLLFLIDTVMPDMRKRDLRRLIAAIGRAVRMSEDRQTELYLRLHDPLVALIRLRPRRLLAALRRLLRSSPPPSPTDEEALFFGIGDDGHVDLALLRDRFRRLRNLYMPERYPGTVSLVVAEDGPIALRGAGLDRWRALVEHLDLIHVPGTHETCLTDHLDDTVAELRARLDHVGPASDPVHAMDALAAGGT